jgi:hypothetical protein
MATGVIGKRVNKAKRQRLFRPYRPAADNHVKRGGKTDQPRQALGPARPRHNAKRYLGKAKLGVGAGNPVPAGKGQFQPTAERRTGNGGNPRNG